MQIEAPSGLGGVDASVRCENGALRGIEIEGWDESC
jgi:hypothetical protein